MSGARDIRFRVDAIDEVAQDIYRMRIASDDQLGLLAGQFVNIKVPGDDSHILRLPLSFADATDHTTDLVFAVVGEGTKRLSEMRVGESSQMTCPLGNGWKLPEKAGRVLVVAGGIGLPPIVAAARMCAQAGIGFDAIVGAQTADKHVGYLEEELSGPIAGLLGAGVAAPKVILTTDDGTLGIKGFVTQAMADLIADTAYTTVFACGPNPMLKAVAELAAKRNIECQVSLERMMGCGFGACSCCNVELKAGGYGLCCTDGPVFDAEEVAW